MKLKSTLPTILLAILGTVQLFVPVTPAEVAPRRIEVIAQRFRYAPAEITLKKGQPVVLVLSTVDTTHGLQVKELDLETKIRKGQPTELVFTPDKTGTFVGHCSVFCGEGHGSMSLTLHIVE